jgi:hypothetical protein
MPAPAGALPLPEFTLEQHVSLCAELVMAPPRTAEILARYHVSAPQKAQLDLQWQGRLKADPALEKRWHEAFRTYCAFLASTGQR